MATWTSGIHAITLFVDDPAVSKRFYCETLGLPAVFEDDDSAVVKLGELLINLLRSTAAPELIDPAPVGDRNAGSRVVFTLPVDDVDARCKELAARGVRLLNGPMDRPWGPRTASFQDLDGHIWEIAQ